MVVLKEIIKTLTMADILKTTLTAMGLSLAATEKEPTTCTGIASVRVMETTVQACWVTKEATAAECMVSEKVTEFMYHTTPELC